MSMNYVLLGLFICVGAILVACFTYYFEQKQQLMREEVNLLIDNSRTAARYSCLCRYLSYISKKTFEDTIHLLIKIDNHLQKNGMYDKRFLFYSIAFVESRFNPRAKTKVAYGLFQINYEANRYILQDLVKDENDLYNEDINIECAIRILNGIKNSYNTENITKILNIYSGDRTGKYAIKVISFADKLEYVFGDNLDEVIPVEAITGKVDKKGVSNEK